MMKCDMIHMDKKKYLGQVFTPQHIVEKMFTQLNYKIGESICEPACGDGIFLQHIIKYIITHSTNIEYDLSKVYGYDIDEIALEKCKENLNNIYEFDYNLYNKDFLKEDNIYYEYIIGNMPFIKIQNLEVDYRIFLQEKYKFCKFGSTDIFYAFFEKSINSANNIIFISPNSYMYSQAGKEFRKYIIENKIITNIKNFKEEMIFIGVSTYTAITQLSKNIKTTFILNDEVINYSDVDINLKKIQIGKKLSDICTINVGITTLMDKVFILSEQQVNSLNIESELLKPIIKGSNLKTKKYEWCIYPYENGKPITEEQLKIYPNCYNYLLSKKELLLTRDLGKVDSKKWYLFGRNQSILSCFGKKIIFCPIQKKLYFELFEEENLLVYSAYFIKCSDYDNVMNILGSDELQKFVDDFGKPINGGYKQTNKKLLSEFFI